MRWTAISTDEMTMITNLCIIDQCEWFLANVAPRRVTVRLLFFFRQRFHGYVSGYDIFHCAKSLSCRANYAISLHHDGSNTMITHHRTRICSILY